MFVFYPPPTLSHPVLLLYCYVTITTNLAAVNKKSTHKLSFCGPGVYVQLSWIPCSRSYKTAIKFSVRLPSHLEFRGPFQAPIVAGRVHLMCYITESPDFCWLLTVGFPQVPEAKAVTTRLSASSGPALEASLVE